MGEAMTPRERWAAVLERRPPDRVPMDLWATPEVYAKLCAHLGVSDNRALFARLAVDHPLAVTPRYVGPAIPTNRDVFGIVYQDVDYGTGTYREAVSHPLAAYTTVDDIRAEYVWPSLDWWDYADLERQVAEWGDYPIQGGGSEPFLIYKNLRGHEQAYMDLILYPDIVHYCLKQLFDLAFRNTERIYESIPNSVMITYVAEDMGSQEGLLFSPAQIREFLLPGMRRMIRLAHEAGAYAFFHSDGAIRRILPDMVAAGIDILNPVQWRCAGMDRQALKRDWGEFVILHGGVDNQQTLAFGTVDDVRREVADNLRILGADGGYILAPCHNIQAISPVENIVAMYEEGLRLGRI